MSDLAVYVYPVQVTRQNNEYTEKLKTNRFVETVRVDSKTGVYKKWETTRYELPTMPTALGF